MFFKQHKRTQKTLFGLLTGLILFVSLFGSFAKPARAQSFAQGVGNCTMAALVSLIAESIASSFASIRVPIDDMPAWIKDTILDCIVWQLKQEIIEDITERTVGYVQSGVDGNPSFVTNIGQYLRTIADKTAGAYIQQTIPLLCSPFQADIQLALTNYYRQYAGIDYFNNISCSLSESVENIDDFVNGDFSSGGWSGWFEFVGNPYNNPIGAYFETKNDLSLRLASATGEAGMKVNLGSGFLSKETQQCYEAPADGNGPPRPIGEDEVGPFQGVVTCDPPQITTPGDTIKTSLEQAFGVSLDQLATADELNEIIALWLTSVFVDILDSDEGLSGYRREDHDFGSTTDDGNPIDPNLPPVQTSCGTGGWLESTATAEGEPVSFTKSGLVLEASPGSANIAFGLPAPAGRIYTKATVSIDVEVGPWFSEAPSDFHQIVFLQRGSSNPNNFDWAENNVGIINLRGPNQNKLVAGHNMNILIGDCTKSKSTGFSPEQGARYNFTYTYDTTNQTVTTVVRKNSRTGQIVASVSDTPTADVIQSNHPLGGNSSGFFVWVGGPDSYEPPEVPMYGWKFYDLSVTIE